MLFGPSPPSGLRKQQRFRGVSNTLRPQHALQPAKSGVALTLATAVQRAEPWRVLPWEPCTPTALRLGRALNGRGRACAARKAAMYGAGAFAASPALLQSAAMGEAGRWHLNPGLNLQAFQGA